MSKIEASPREVLLRRIDELQQDIAKSQAELNELLLIIDPPNDENGKPLGYVERARRNRTTL